MSTSNDALTAPRTVRFTSGRSVAAQTRIRVPADTRRAIQVALGLLWLLDGALQFQSFMYSHGFVDMLKGTASDQPAWLASSINWAAGLAQHNLTVFNTLFALTQVLIGAGLLYRRTLKPALAASVVWSVIVWWFGEGLGLLFTNTASPLTGAPGAVLLYAIVSLLVWPREQPGGLLGLRAAKVTWAVLWVGMGWLWLLDANSSANATSDAISNAPSGMGWLTSVQHAAAQLALGNGLVIAATLAVLSCAIGLGVATDRRPKAFLGVAIALSAVYWMLGQGLGGLFTGSATDPSAAPLLILLAAALYPLCPDGVTAHSSAWTERFRRIEVRLRPRQADSRQVAAASIVCSFAAPAALWAVTQMPFARAPSFANTPLDAAQAMPSGHKWLTAVIIAQVVWAMACAFQFLRGRLSPGLFLGTALAVVAGLLICSCIFAAHLVSAHQMVQYDMMPVGATSQAGVLWRAFGSFLLVGSAQLAVGTYAVLSTDSSPNRQAVPIAEPAA